MKNILRFLCAAGLVGLTHLGQSQITITGSLPQNYTQNFDSFGTNDVVWTDNSVLPGWLIIKGTGAVTNLVANNGNIISTEVYNYGSNNSSDRALGSIAGFNEDTFYGARFVNNSSGTITNVNVAYAGEQWRASVNSPQQNIDFLFRVGGNDFLATNSGWTSVASLGFNSPRFGENTFTDGNNPTNRVLVSGDIAVNIAPGGEFWIRWADLDNPAQTDHGLGVDDVSLTFNGINPPPALEGVTIELKKPKVGKKLKVSKKGIKVKGFIFSTSNTVSKASYAAFGGTNSPTNLTFVEAGKFKLLTKGKLFKKKGVDAIFQSTKSTKITGVTASPVTLLVKVEGGSNNASSVIFTNVFTDVKIK